MKMQQRSCKPYYLLLQVCQVNDNLGKPLDNSCLMPVRYGHYNDSLNNEINMNFKYAPGGLNSFVAQVSWLS